MRSSPNNRLNAIIEALLAARAISLNSEAKPLNRPASGIGNSHWISPWVCSSQNGDKAQSSGKVQPWWLVPSPR